MSGSNDGVHQPVASTVAGECSEGFDRPPVPVAVDHRAGTDQSRRGRVTTVSYGRSRPIPAAGESLLCGKSSLAMHYPRPCNDDPDLGMQA